MGFVVVRTGVEDGQALAKGQMADVTPVGRLVGGNEPGIGAGCVWDDKGDSDGGQQVGGDDEGQQPALRRSRRR